MAVFVTGATGFIGRYLLERLVRRRERVHCLVRRGSVERLRAIAERVDPGGELVVPVEGDLEAPLCGLDASARELLAGQVDQFFHVAALYDMGASSEALRRANVEGTRHALALADALAAGCFHHVSSIAVAGHYRGVFTEQMFDEAEGLEDAYSATKHDAEGLVRSTYPRAYRIYRPGIVVGHSETGEIDKIDGPYYFFKLIQRLRDSVPSWLPRIGIDGALLNIVPVDYVAAALDHIAFEKDLDGRTFHLVDPDPMTLGEVMNVFCKAAGAPPFTVQIPARRPRGGVAELLKAVQRLPLVRRASEELLAELGIPEALLGYGGHSTAYDCKGTLEALVGSDIAPPRLESYAEPLWHFWETHYSNQVRRNPALARAVEGRRVLITGASAGIGRATAERVAASGGHVILVARSKDKLTELASQIERNGGHASVHVADLSDIGQCDALVDTVIREHGGVDILVNNAGRSIRRSVELSYDRFHDFERTIQLNYFGALKLILGLLPGMRERRRGQIINVSSMGVQMHSPRFSAYLASKAALDTFAMCVAPELVDDSVVITTVHMPLVDTDMIAPTKAYRGMYKLSPGRAASMICRAMVRRPPRVSTLFGVYSELAQITSPEVYQRLSAVNYRLFPDSEAARGGAREE